MGFTYEPRRSEVKGYGVEQVMGFDKYGLGQFSDKKTDTQGFIARDDAKQEFIVAFRGSSNVKDAEIFMQSDLIEYPGFGSFPPHVHKGFFTAYSSVQQTVVTTLKTALAADNGTHAHYTLVAVGHDSGGSLAAFAGATLRSTFFDNLSRTYTYGQPRTGDLQWAFFIDELMGFSVFRSVNKRDGVPKIFPLNITDGYVHHPAEYWTHSDPPSAETTTACQEFGEQVVGEDEACSISVNTHLPNVDHYTYFGIPITQSICTV
ncbi:alpha/beta-hydrolase [Exidia glandulosa HHB12029]|uniref:Alpha/beta-hydrolase n=1 Tax=Exidia glandulosa HHB12029 TaxID=1314781 RepID=A0A165E6F8_EXIGL|nr:alpha/beta-hydrolase [Exidia glandulosa HHB12029]